MNRPLVTIAVPIYGVEKFLDRCICSLTEQTYRQLEIILVDDCSPDDCPQICDRWAARDERIKVVHKIHNAGQGMARNDAIDMATGKYICFIDADDYLDTGAVEQLVYAAEKEKAEITVFGMKSIAADGTEIARFIPGVGERTYKGEEVQERFLPDFLAPDPTGDGKMVFYLSSCVLMYAVEKLRKLNWHYVSEREIISEDVYSMLNLFDSITSVTVVPQPFYCYYTNSSSFSRRYTPGRYEKIKHFYLETVELCKKKKYSQDIIHRVSSPYIAYTLATLKQETKAPITWRERWRNVRSIIQDEVLQQVLEEKRRDNESIRRKIAFFLLRNKLLLLCYLLFWIKN